MNLVQRKKRQEQATQVKPNAMDWAGLMTSISTTPSGYPERIIRLTTPADLGDNTNQSLGNSVINATTNSLRPILSQYYDSMNWIVGIDEIQGVRGLDANDSSPVSR